MYNCIVRISGFLLSNYLSDNSIAHSTQVIHEFRNFCNTNNGISNPLSWALPTPGLRNKVGFSGNTINAEGIR